MMWHKKHKEPEPKIGDERIVTKFLLLPKCLNGIWRWMECADIVQEYRKHRIASVEYHVYGYYTKWDDIRWVDIPKLRLPKFNTYNLC